jgi:hypothetical protein
VWSRRLMRGGSGCCGNARGPCRAGKRARAPAVPSRSHRWKCTLENVKPRSHPFLLPRPPVRARRGACARS